MTVASATMLTGIPLTDGIPFTNGVSFTNGTTAYAKEAAVRRQAENRESSPVENATTYDLSDVSRITDKEVTDFMGVIHTAKVMEFNIVEDGNYIFTGSNEINGAYEMSTLPLRKG